MNEQDLREQMEISVGTDLGQPVVDPAADIARGRRRLRRRRVASGFAAATSVAAVAALGLQFLPAFSGDRTAPPAAGQPMSARDAATAAVVQEVQTQKLSTVVRRHVDPTGAYTVGKREEAFTTKDASKPLGIGALTFTHEWKQDGGVGLLWVSVAYPDHAPARTKWCGPRFTKDLMAVRCFDTKDANGRPVVGGSAGSVANSKGVFYVKSGGQFARYERPDGQVVIVAVLRMKSLKRVADDLPEGVTAPRVTREQLYAAATDPAMTLAEK